METGRLPHRQAAQTSSKRWECRLTSDRKPRLNRCKRMASRSFFAPNYHPAFKHIGPARKVCAGRGRRTIFNFLGPLLNPARPTAQLVGVPRPELCESLARVLQGLGVRRGMVVSGRVQSDLANPSEGTFLDELSTLGPNTIAEFYQERGFTVSQNDTTQFDLQPATLADLAGSDAKSNAAIVLKLLHGEERGPKRDAVLLNSAAALFVANRVRTLIDGWNWRPKS